MNQRDHFNSGIRHGQAAQASDSIQAHYGAAQAQPISQVEAALSQIDAGMEDLHNTIKRITGRMDLVLSAPGISAEGSPHPAEPASSTPLVRRLNGLATELRLHCADLQDLERRLAL